MSPPDAVLGVDLGTSAAKAGIYTLDGVLRSSGSTPIPLRRMGHGRVEQDLDGFYTAVVAATRAALGASAFDPGRIGAIAIAGQMAGVGIVDAANRPLAPFDSWLDTRCGDLVQELATTSGELIARTAGCAPTISIGPKMAWWSRDTRAIDGAASFVTAAGYVTARAAGRSGADAFIDPTHLHFTAVADVGTASWHEGLVEATGIVPDLLPTIVESTSIVGHLTHDAARDLGLRAGTPIAAGCGDTAAGALGAGVTESGEAFDLAGTAAVFGVCMPTFRPDGADGALITMRAALPGRWYSLAYVGDAGQVIEWACREVLGNPDADDAAYADLAAAAATVPAGSDGVLVSPHFSGRVAPVAPSMRGTVLGLSPHHGRAHLARATLEAIAYEYRGYADRVRALTPGHAVRTVTGTGGGSRSDVWNQIKADVLGVPYIPIAGIDAGTRGAATVASCALGRPTPELRTAGSGAVFHPDPATRGVHDATYDDYRWWTGHLAEGYRERARARQRQDPPPRPGDLT